MDTLIERINEIFHNDEYLINTTFYKDSLEDDKQLYRAITILSNDRNIKECVNYYFNNDSVITNNENFIDTLDTYKYILICPKLTFYEDDFLLYNNAVRPKVFNKIIKYIINIINDEKKNGEIYNLSLSYEIETDYFIRKLNDIYNNNEYLKGISYFTPDLNINSLEKKYFDMYVERHIINKPRIKNYIDTYLSEQDFMKIYSLQFDFPSQDQADCFSPNYSIIKKRIIQYILDSINNYTI